MRTIVGGIMAKKFVPMTAAEIKELGEGAPKVPAGPNEIAQQAALPISQMGVDPELLAQMSRRVQSLTGRDLEDLTRRIAGVEVQNELVTSLTLEDIQGLEALFRDQRKQTLVNLAATMGDDGSIAQQKLNVSCCCCTPCCSCAATDVSPFED